MKAAVSWRLRGSWSVGYRLQSRFGVSVMMIKTVKEPIEDFGVLVDN